MTERKGSGGRGMKMPYGNCGKTNEGWWKWKVDSQKNTKTGAKGTYVR